MAWRHIQMHRTEKTYYQMKDPKKQHDLDLRYLRMAHIWSENSYCQRRQVGALVVKDKMIISDGSTLYVTDSPCIECAKLIIQAGIKRVIYSREYRLTDGVDLLRRAGIEVKFVPIENS